MDNKQMEEKRFINAIDFLIFSYWGFSIGEKTKDKPDTVIKKIVSKAYNDAAGQKAFNALIGRTNVDLRTRATTAMENAKDTVCNAIKIFEGNYKNWHSNLCDAVSNCFSNIKIGEKSLWSYGNSQKIVNMSVKYIVTLTIILKSLKIENDVTKIGDNFLDIINELDIPVDSYIIEALWTEGTIDIPTIDAKCTKGRLKYSSEKYTPWSNWSIEQYNNFENSLKKYLKENPDKPKAPFDWEGPKWIEVAKNRRI